VGITAAERPSGRARSTWTGRAELASTFDEALAMLVAPASAVERTLGL
jgi:hypothetical protein